MNSRVKPQKPERDTVTAITTDGGLIYSNPIIASLRIAPTASATI